MLEAKATELIAQLSGKLGVASNKIWEWCLLQVNVRIINTILLTVACIIGSLLVIKLARYLNKSEEYSGVLFVATGVFGVLLAFLDIAVIYELCTLPQLIINPEFSAFQILVEQIQMLMP